MTILSIGYFRNDGDPVLIRTYKLGIGKWLQKSGHKDMCSNISFMIAFFLKETKSKPFKKIYKELS